MFSIHSPSCKGPPLGCDRGYWIICVIVFVASFLEGFIARSAAESYSAQTDAIHMSLHGAIYGSILYVNSHIRKRKVSASNELRLRLKSARLNVSFLLIMLAYLVFIETLPKIWHPTPVAGKWMLFSVFFGIIGTISIFLILNGMKKQHESESCSLGRSSLHKTLMWDAVTDLNTSIAVLIAAILITVDQNLSWIDPYLTIIATIYIAWQMRNLLRSIREDEKSHLSHNH